jgi:hypothetical protein
VRDVVPDRLLPYRLDPGQHRRGQAALVRGGRSNEQVRLRLPDRERGQDGGRHGEGRRNETHASTTDPEAGLDRKGRGKEARLSFMGHALLENRHGRIVAGRAGRGPGDGGGGPRHPITLGGDKGYATRDFVAGARALRATWRRTRPTAAPRATAGPRGIPAMASANGHGSGSKVKRDRERSPRKPASRRLDQGGSPAASGSAPRQGKGRLTVHARRGGLQLDPPAETPGSAGMSASCSRQAVPFKAGSTGGAPAPSSRSATAPSSPVSAACQFLRPGRIRG